MTYLSRTAKLGIAAEPTDATYAVPQFTIPFERGTRFSDHIIQLHDNTVRASDADLQDVQQGPYWTDWTISTLGYPDWAGWLLRAMIGPDQCAPGVATTFAAGCAAGATSVLLAAAPPSGSVLMLGTGTTLEYAQAGTPTGTGPYTVPVAGPYGLLHQHAAGDPVQSQATHMFQQNRPLGVPWPSYSLTTDDGVETLGWPGCILGKLQARISDTGWLRFTATYSGYPPLSEATFTENEPAAQPPAGWGWQVTTAGGSSTRGKTLDLSLSRVLDIVPCLNGQQSPYVIATGPMRTSGTYSAIFDTTADLDLYRQAIQEPAVWTFTQPVLQGGSSLTLTLSRSAWTKGTVSLEDTYVTADFSLAGVANVTDSPHSGVASATLVNYVQTPYGP